MKVEIFLSKKKVANVLVVAVCYDLRFLGCILRRDLSYHTLNHLILKDLLALLDTRTVRMVLVRASIHFKIQTCRDHT